MNMIIFENEKENHIDFIIILVIGIQIDIFFM